jgi:hypothetical protein
MRKSRRAACTLLLAFWAGAVPKIVCCAAAARVTSAVQPHPVGLGKVLSAKDKLQIFGYDIDQDGDDGVLATAGFQGNVFAVDVETFDQNSGKIVKSFATRNSARNSYAADGIFNGDAGLITHYVTPKGEIYPRRVYDVMYPVTANRFTGSWTPPIKDVDVKLVAEDQAASKSVVYAIELKNSDAPDLIVSDVAHNTFDKIIHLNAKYLNVESGPQLGIYAAANAAVMAESPDGGRVDGEAPINFLIDLKTGKTKQFNGYNNGFYTAGFVNGLATDPNTGITATDTELNAQVEFYDMAKRKGITSVQLPCTGDTDQGSSGAGIAVDPVNKLFLVTESYNACTGSGSAIIVYDEAGNYVETIPDFIFGVAEPAPALNPGKRMGWTYGGPSGVFQLQQFYY